MSKLGNRWSDSGMPYPTWGHIFAHGFDCETLFSKFLNHTIFKKECRYGYVYRFSLKKKIKFNM